MKEQQQCTRGLIPALDVIGGKWKPLMLWEMSLQPPGFGALKRLVPGISETMLIQALRELETDGVVHREVQAAALLPSGRLLRRVDAAELQRG